VWLPTLEEPPGKQTVEMLTSANAESVSAVTAGMA